MRIIVGITGASGVWMGYRMVTALKSSGHEVFLIISDGGKETWSQEVKQSMADLTALADQLYDNSNLSANIASGSYLSDGMIVIPCSMKTLSGIANGYAENLMNRAADVCLKEGRKVVLVPREMPLGKVHLKNLMQAAELGCVIVPPMLTFYHGASTLDSQVDHIIGKIMAQFHLSYHNFFPWTGGENVDRSAI